MIKSRRLRSEVITCRRLAQWCRKPFNLQYAAGNFTIARQMNAPFPYDQPETMSKVVRSQKCDKQVLEAALFAWVCRQVNHSRMINGAIIMEKGRRLQELYFRNYSLKDLVPKHISIFPLVGDGSRSSNGADLLNILCAMKSLAMRIRTQRSVQCLV